MLGIIIALYLLMNGFYVMGGLILVLELIKY